MLENSLHYYSMPLGALLRGSLLKAFDNKLTLFDELLNAAAAYAFSFNLKKKPQMPPGAM
jgi:hypothetical protein